MKNEDKMQKKFLLFGLTLMCNHVYASEPLLSRTVSPTSLKVDEIKTAEGLGLITPSERLLLTHEVRVASILSKTAGKPGICHRCGLSFRGHIGKEQGERWCEIKDLLLADDVKCNLLPATRRALEFEQASLESPRKF